MTGLDSRALGRAWTLLAAALLLAFATTAMAETPKTMDHRDDKAPCYRWPAVDFDGDGVYDRIDYCPNTPKGCIVDERGCSTDADGDGVCDGVDKCANTPAGSEVDEFGCSAAQRGASGAVQQTKPATPPATRQTTSPPPTRTPVPSKPATETERQLVEGGRVRLENIYFETGSAKLLPESETALDEAGAALEKFVDLKVEVQGHTDTRGSSALNQRLSQARAESVRSYLLAKFRLRGENLIAKGYGESQPETQERNDEERLRNRRVELSVLNPEVLPKNVKIEGQ